MLYFARGVFLNAVRIIQSDASSSCAGHHKRKLGWRQSRRMMPPGLALFSHDSTKIIVLFGVTLLVKVGSSGLESPFVSLGLNKSFPINPSRSSTPRLR